LDSFKKLHEAVDHVKRVATNKPAIKNTKKENIVSSLGTMKNSTSSSSIGITKLDCSFHSFKDWNQPHTFNYSYLERNYVSQ